MRSHLDAPARRARDRDAERREDGRHGRWREAGRVDSYATADGGLCRAEAGVTEVIPVEGCCPGWQESLLLKAQLVQAEIPG